VAEIAMRSASFLRAYRLALRILESGGNPPCFEITSELAALLDLDDCAAARLAHLPAGEQIGHLEPFVPRIIELQKTAKGEAALRMAQSKAAKLRESSRWIGEECDLPWGLLAQLVAEASFEVLGLVTDIAPIFRTRRLLLRRILVAVGRCKNISVRLRDNQLLIIYQNEYRRLGKIILFDQVTPAKADRALIVDLVGCDRVSPEDLPQTTQPSRRRPRVARDLSRIASSQLEHTGRSSAL
jgi:hypothetical protein